MSGAPVNAAQVRDLLARHAFGSLPTSEELSARNNPIPFLSTLAEASFLVSHGDHRFAREEVTCLVGTLSELSAGALDRSALAGMIYEFSASIQRDGLDARLDALASRIRDRNDRIRLVGFAALVAMCDRTLQPGEREVLDRLAAKMGISADELDRFVTSLQGSLHAG